MVAGVSAQAVARRLRIPGIVLLLAAGVFLGPDVSGLIQPRTLGGALPAVVGFGVAVILFEGGLNQDLRRLRREAIVIRRLVTVGAVITAAGSAVVAHLCLGWGWRMSTLFGTLVIVTGPTVISPLLRRIRVNPSVETVLEAEGIFIDAIGAIIAVAALEFCLSPSAASLGSGIGRLAIRLAVGAGVGLCGGALLVVMIGRSRVVPEALASIFTLSLVVLVFELSNALMHESGIAAVIVVGMVVGSSGIKFLEQLVDLHGQLTVLLIAVLFVLLAADVRLADVHGLGAGGLFAVVALVVIVRPLDVFLCTIKTGLSLREKLFLSWLAPRGIVAAAVASFFAHELARAGIPGGTEVRAMVFLVIAVTVLVQGGTGKLVAGLLGVTRAGPNGFVLVGANSLSRAIAGCLRERGEEVVLIDTSDKLCREAEGEGHRVIRGSALKEDVLVKARVERCRGVAAVTSSAKVNFMVAVLVAREHGGPTLAIGLNRDDVGVTPATLAGFDIQVLFARTRDLEQWTLWLRNGHARVVRRICAPAAGRNPPAMAEIPDCLLPLVVERAGSVFLVDDRARLEPGDIVDLAVRTDLMPAALEWLEQAGLDDMRRPERDPFRHAALSPAAPVHALTYAPRAPRSRLA